MKNSAPSAGPRNASHAADHHHGDQLPGEGDRQRLSRSETVIEDREHAGDGHHRRREHEADQLVAVGRIADEPRALLIFADRDEHAADRRAMKAPQQDADRHPDRCHHPIIDDVTLEVDAKHGGAGDAAEPAFTAGEVGPTIGDGEQQCGEGQRQQREIHTATAQDQRAREGGNDGDEGNREQCRQYDAPAEPIELAQGRRIGAKPEPGSVAERNEAGIADQDIETHTGDREHHHVDRGAQRQAGKIERIGENGQR